jgi:hypothetical protein
LGGINTMNLFVCIEKQVGDGFGAPAAGLRVLLDKAPHEATTTLRQKWAGQIRDTVPVLHSLGIL